MSAIERIEVRFGGDPADRYPAWIGAGALERGLDELDLASTGRLFVVSSAPILDLHGQALLEALRAESGTPGATAVEVLEVADGEAAKTPEEATALWRKLLQAGGKRDSVVLAFGGGSVGDLAGFVAGTFLRGVRVVQLPTTLLAQVDASVGGKTAIDLPEAKNSVGVFHQPLSVVADTTWLGTLERRQLAAGLFEVVKMAALLDLDLLARVEEGIDRLLAGDLGSMPGIVAAAVRAKAGVVERDPFEENERKLLNFGHTLGHALESTAGYRDLLHGEAVGYGMLFALGLATECRAESTPPLPLGDARRLARLIHGIGLPPLPAMEPSRILEAVARDKKARESGITWVLPSRLGAGELRDDVSPEQVATELERFLDNPWRLLDGRPI